MKFVKMQGAGNDFVVLEAEGKHYDWSRLAIAMCDRHYGIGADGVLLLVPSDKADFRMRIFNSDGSEAEACGNGLRCLVRYYADRKLGNSRDREITVETMTGIRRASIHHAVGSLVVKVGMGEPGFGEKDIPVVLARGKGRIVALEPVITYALQVNGHELPLNLVNIGNPHAVYFSERPAGEFPLSELGPKVEHHPMFPRGANFEVVCVLNRKQIEAAVWEKGVGKTLACGSGACAIAVAARLKGYIGDSVAIKLPGGVLEVEWSGKGEVLLSGPAETVFTGEWLDGRLD